jgi:uracil-DNA glycosylase
MLTKTKLNPASFREKFGSFWQVVKPGFQEGLLDPVFAHLKSLPKGSVSPGSQDLFRAFSECPYEDLKVIILCDEPYIEGADGLALSSRKENSTGGFSHLYTLPEPLHNWYHSIEKEVYNGLELEGVFQNDLTYLANSGILLLNTAFTRDGENIHRKLWKPFVSFVLSQISYLEVPVIFMGQHCREFEDCLSPFQERFFTDFPSSRKWEGGRIFKQVRDLLGEMKEPEKEKIWIERLPF